MSTLREPQGYRILCQKLQVERNPAKFRQLLEEIDHLLRDYEKTTRVSAGEPNSLEPSLELAS